MLTLDRITQRADEDNVDADVVERDYVLTHVIVSLALHPDNTLVQFKGGTALRLCHFADYRYSADIDLNRDPSASDEQVRQLLEEVLAATSDRVGLPELRLNEDAAPVIEFIGPKETKRPRAIKLDITGDELVIDGANRSAILNRYEDQPDAPPLRVYSLAETTAEKMRSMMQRLQCRDLYDVWYLLEHAGVDPSEIKADFEAKTRHRNFDPDDFPQRFEKRLAEYRQRWTRELSPYMSDLADVDRVIRQTSRHLRRAGYLQSGE